jgi:TonB family protein
MDCQAISGILDERAVRRLSPAERCEVDRHLAACESCSAGWHGYEALAAMKVADTPPHLLEDVINSISSRSAEAPRRRLASLLTLYGAAFAAAAAIAAVAVVKTPQHPGAHVEPVQGHGALVYPSRDRADDPGIVVHAQPRKAPEKPLSPIVRVPPEYPVEALRRGLEGWVRVEFTVTSTGAVANADVVASSGSVFEAPTLEAVGRWRFAPQLVDGNPVDVPRVQTTIRFQLTDD